MAKLLQRLKKLRSISVRDFEEGQSFLHGPSGLMVRLTNRSALRTPSGFFYYRVKTLPEENPNKKPKELWPEPRWVDGAELRR